MILNYLSYFWIILQSIPLTADPHSTTSHLLGSNTSLHSSIGPFLHLTPWNWTSKGCSMCRCALQQKFPHTEYKWLIVRYFHLYPKPSKWSLNGRGYRSKVGSINSFRRIFEFISSKLLSERRKQCEHCDRLTSNKLPKEIKNYRKVYQSAIYTF